MTELVLSERLSGDYQIAAELVAQRSELTTQMDAQRAAILGGITVQRAADANRFESTEPTDPDILAMLPGPYLAEAAIGRIEEEIIDMRAALSKIAVGQAVTVRALIDNPEQPAIVGTYSYGALIGPPPQQRTRRVSQEVRGTITRVLAGKNYNHLILSPQRFTGTHVDDGSLRVTVLDEAGQPQVDIEPRKRSLTRDAKGPLGHFSDYLRRSIYG